MVLFLWGCGMKTQCIGYRTSKNTKLKQIHFKNTLLAHAKITRGIFKRNEWANPIYHFFDLNAGPGRNPENNEPGSPIIFVDVMEELGIRFDATFFEIEAKNHCALKQNINSINIGNINKISCINEDHSTSFEKYCQFIYSKKANYGLIYSDQSGQCPPFDLFKNLSLNKSFKYIDFLIYVSATNIKRIRRSKDENLTLCDMISGINKKHWIIRTPVDRHQWTFLIGTNWNAFPEFKTLGFHNIDSPVGREIIERCNLTDGERKIANESRQLKINYSSYQEYLRTPEFRQVRASAMQRDGGR